MQNEFHELEELNAQGVGDEFSDVATLEPVSDLRTESFKKDINTIRTVEQLRQFFTHNIDSLFERTRALCYQSADRAEEVVQELYPRLIRFLERNPDGIREPWAAVCCIARRLAVDDYRRKVRGFHEQLPGDDFLPDTAQSLQREIDEFEQLETLIRDAMNRLDPRLAVIVRGVYFDDRRSKDLSADLGLSESRISELKSLALSQMRTHLEQSLYQA